MWRVVGVHSLLKGACINAHVEIVLFYNLHLLLLTSLEDVVIHLDPCHSYELNVLFPIDTFLLHLPRCVSRFTAHKNPSLPLPVTFSPCARYISTGSEDRCVRVMSYDKDQSWACWGFWLLYTFSHLGVCPVDIELFSTMHLWFGRPISMISGLQPHFISWADTRMWCQQWPSIHPGSWWVHLHDRVCVGACGIMKVCMWQHEGVHVASWGCACGIVRVCMWQHEGVHVATWGCACGNMRVCMWQHEGVHVATWGCACGIVRVCMWQHEGVHVASWRCA